jgi:hypothetical protein
MIIFDENDSDTIHRYLDLKILINPTFFRHKYNA